MKKKNIIVFVILFLLILFSVVVYINKINNKHNLVSDNKLDDSNEILVITSLFPWYDLAKQIGGDYVEVSLLLPPGVGAHSFEPRPNDIIDISQAGLFIYTGDYLEPWAKDIITSLGSNAPENIALGEGLAYIGLEEADVHEEHEHEDVDNMALDPHIWMNPKIYLQLANRLALKFSQIDPEHAEYYNNRLAIYTNLLENLDNDYQETLSNCEQNKFIYAGHYAFGYLADRYNLQYEAAQGFSPNAESDPQRLIELVDILRASQLDYIFSEELDSPQLAESLSRELGIDILLLSSAHNVSKDKMQAGITYIEIMRNNLAQLKLGLKCQ